MSLFKRISREEVGGDVLSTDHIKMANYLMFLSRGVEVGFTPSITPQYSSNRVFECKTCSRQFPSFQALGGHRASHKRPRLTNRSSPSLDASSSTTFSPPKPKTHECSICGLEFGIGQALGGHMRRHRAATTMDVNTRPQQADDQVVMKHDALVKINNSSKRIVCLDLNLTPLENDLEFRLGTGTKVVIASMVG